MAKLSNHQLAFLISHCETDLRPFINEPIENKTRRSLIIRGLIHYEPRTPSRLGIPKGTMLTDQGHCEACRVLGEMADQLSHAVNYEQPIDRDRQQLLHDALAECARHWRNEERRRGV